jgi:hypothetical protein
MKLRGFERAYVRRVRLIQQRRQLAEDRTSLGNGRNLCAALGDAHCAAFENEELPRSRAFCEHGLARAIARERKRGKPALPGLLPSFGVFDQ